jgi:tRNA 2-thiouridine synthesizing protein E
MDDWDKDIAEYFAAAEGIRMTDEHWVIVQYLRDYYRQYQIAPMIKVLVKNIGNILKRGSVMNRYLYELYPDGPAKQACKIAGLPGSAGCV